MPPPNLKGDECGGGDEDGVEHADGFDDLDTASLASEDNEPDATSSSHEAVVGPNELLFTWINLLYMSDSELSAAATYEALLPRAVAHAREHGVTTAREVRNGGDEPWWFTMYRVQTQKRKWRDKGGLLEIDRITRLQAIEGQLRELTPLFDENRGHALPMHVTERMATAFALAFLDEVFELHHPRLRSKQWNKFMHHVHREREHFAGLRRMREEAKERFSYTDSEARFCDAFDLKASRWEDTQQQLVDGFDGQPCAVCAELRPRWMMKVHLVTDAMLTNECKPEVAALLNKYNLVGRLVCNRCLRPDKEELQAGILRFSAANHAMPILPAMTADVPFSYATPAEIALVRLTIPCIEIKVLKHGGTLSKTHSVRALE